MRLQRRQIPEEQFRKFEGYVAEMLTALGLDLQLPATRDTPQRFVRAMYDATAGYEGDHNNERPRLVGGRRFAPEHPLWGTLAGVKRGGSHLFLRYAFHFGMTRPRTEGPVWEIRKLLRQASWSHLCP